MTGDIIHNLYDVSEDKLVLLLLFLRSYMLGQIRVLVSRHNRGRSMEMTPSARFTSRSGEKYILQKS